MTTAIQNALQQFRLCRAIREVRRELNALGYQAEACSEQDMISALVTLLAGPEGMHRDRGLRNSA